MSCPICTSRPVARYHPFCSRRCADIDLGRWINGGYTIPEGDDADPDDREDDRVSSALRHG